MSATESFEERVDAYPGLEDELDAFDLSTQVRLIRYGWLRAHQYHSELPVVRRTPGYTHEHEDGREWLVLGTEDGYLASPDPVEVEQ